MLLVGIFSSLFHLVRGLIAFQVLWVSFGQAQVRFGLLFSGPMLWSEFTVLHNFFSDQILICGRIPFLINVSNLINVPNLINVWNLVKVGHVLAMFLSVSGCLEFIPFPFLSLSLEIPWLRHPSCL